MTILRVLLFGLILVNSCVVSAENSVQLGNVSDSSVDITQGTANALLPLPTNKVTAKDIQDTELTIHQASEDKQEPRFEKLSWIIVAGFVSFIFAVILWRIQRRDPSDA